MSPKKKKPNVDKRQKKENQKNIEDGLPNH